ncbi:hypothetical protein CBR_g37755 [Chara braunii]|uniref:Integrase catalytic domain-containing protein n=1 Tax=Chara braunii TaxID=69332 RepID=A0A388LNS2_CHABU|nr:hypothetical protein CBR_g37755 [Chara braunii]|eukprot:GBG83885.1 hypothetical protein CBR_g37755 [Chara braunii]
MLTRSQTAVMDQKPGETAEAYQDRMLALIIEAKQRADAVADAEKKKAEDAEQARLLALEQQRLQAEAAAKAADEERLKRREKIFSGEQALLTLAAECSSNTSNRLDALETDVSTLKDGARLQQTATQQLEQRVCAATASPSSGQRESTPKFDGQEIFCDSTKTDPVQWFCKFELTLQLHLVSECKHHAYLYSQSGGACQAWLDNLLSQYGVVAVELHTKINWEDLKAAWHKWFQVEPPEIKAMDKLMTFEQGSLPSVDWIAEYQRLTSVPGLPMGFKAIKHYFISRSCPTLSNALTHVEDTLTTTAQLFDKAAQIIITNKEAKSLTRAAAGPSKDQHRPKVAVVAAASPSSQSSKAESANEGDRLAAARDDSGLPYQGEGQAGKLSAAESQSTTLSTPSEPVSSRVTGHSGAHAEVDSPLLYSFEDYAARLVPVLGSFAQGQDVCAASSPSDNSSSSSSSGSSRDSARGFNIEELDPLKSGDFAWLPLPTTGRLPGPQCAALCAHLHKYLSFYAPPTSPTDDEVAVGDILAYVTKVAREFRTQRYDDNNAPLMYVRIQVGQASCSALLDSGATRNFMSQAFMQRAGLGAQVRRKANPTAIKLADGKTQQLLDRYIEAVPVHFAPHACEPVTFDILDTDFDIILGMPWLASVDHTVNFHQRTLTVRDAFGAEVPCTIPLPHPSIRCQVVTAKSFRTTSRHPQTDGQTERAHQTTQVLLRTLIRPDQKDWVERLPDAELAYKSSIHPAIGMSPFEFEHGSPVTSPLDTIVPRTAESDDHLLFLRRMQELLVKACNQMAKTQQRMSQQANRQRLPCPFRAGDLVWVSAAEFSLEQDISRKLLPKWMGPWPIVAPAGDAPEGPSFTVQVPAHLPVYPVFHCSKLALYTPADLDDFPGRRSQDPPSMDDFQEVGDIISQRRYGNKPTEYLVHFAYCTHRADRWLTRAELQATAPDVLVRYERKMQGKPVSSAPRLNRVQVPPADRRLRPRPGLTS